MDKSPIEVGKAQKGLDILDFPRFRPVLNILNFCRVHSKAVWGKDETKVLNSVRVELAFVSPTVESIFSESF